MIIERELPTSRCGFSPCKKIGGLVVKKDTETKEHWISCNYCRTNWNGYIISAEDEETITILLRCSSCGYTPCQCHNPSVVVF